MPKHDSGGGVGFRAVRRRRPIPLGRGVARRSTRAVGFGFTQRNRWPSIRTAHAVRLSRRRDPNGAEMLASVVRGGHGLAPAEHPSTAEGIGT
jgi:hypothetical protein